jgi:hypothetical protein
MSEYKYYEFQAIDRTLLYRWCLRDLAAEENKFEPFQTRLDRIYDNHGNRHSLIKRFQKVRLDRS